MPSPRTRIRTLWVLLLLASWPAVAAAQSKKAPGFQVQLDGLLYNPGGSMASVGGADLSTLLPQGPGFALGGSVGLARHWILGARVSYFGSDQDGSFSFVDSVNTNGQLFTDGHGPYHLNRKLRATVILGLLQYRHPLGTRIQWALEGGGGVTKSQMKLVLSDASGEKANAVGVQLDPSIGAGGELGYLMNSWNTDLVAGVRWSMTLAGDGAVWTNGDAPSYLNWTLGVRYPHETH